MSESNPFAKRGQPVSGDRLVGRKSIVDKIVRRVLCCSHCSIVGLPRLGKTSVAKETLKQVVSLNSIFTVAYITLDAIGNPIQFYARLLSELDGNQSEIDMAFKHTSHNEAYFGFERALKNKKKLGQLSIVVIDEFDSVVRKEFEDAPLFISRLREIANDIDRYGLVFIFVSRRSLDMIQGVVDCSTLAGLCEVIYLKPLDNCGLQELIARCNMPRDESVVDSLMYFTGGHPYLSEVIMCEANDSLVKVINSDVIENSQQIQNHEFINQYHLLQRLLSYDGLFENLCELVIGPRWRTINVYSECLLKQYGLLCSATSNNTNIFTSFSKHYLEFLKQHVRTTPTWFMLGEVEKQLRYLVSDSMATKHGVNWFESLKQKYPKLLDALEKLSTQQFREKKLFGDAASDLILDYAYIGDLKDMIYTEWDSYRSVLSGSKSDWERRFQDIMKVRNPMAHHRIIPTDIIQNAEKSCKVFLEHLNGKIAQIKSP